MTQWLVVMLQRVPDPFVLVSVPAAPALCDDSLAGLVLLCVYDMYVLMLSDSRQCMC